MLPQLDISLLYVEDEEGIRNSVERSLALSVKKVVALSNGIEAIQYLHNNHVDLIVTDIRMPNMDGITLIETLRKEGFKTPIVITSDFNDTDYLLKAIELKVDKFINKPIRINELLTTITQVSDNISNEKTLKLRQEELNRYRAALEQAMYKIKIDKDGKIIKTNHLVNDFINSDEEFSHYFVNIENLIGKEETEALLTAVKQLKVFNKTLAVRVVDKHFTVILTAFASLVQNNNIEEITVLFNDITPDIKAKDQMISELYTDKVTGLPNRMRLFHDLEEEEKKSSLLVIDLENFSKFNQLYGFESGDKILLQMRDILFQFCLKHYPMTLYRNDADRFIILTQKFQKEDIKQVEVMTTSLIKEIGSYPFEIAPNLQVNIDVSVGASCSGEKDLLSEALMSLDVAKKTNKPFVCFDTLVDLRTQIDRNLRMQIKVKRALEENFFINYYQPIVNADGEFVKYEVLVRMIDPDNTQRVLTPASFLEITKQSKNYALLTHKVLKNAFDDFGKDATPFSINLSYDDIANPDTTLYLEELFQSYPKANVTLELLESESFKDLDETLRFFHRVRQLGAKIAIDDFGTGYSNFAYFFDIPVDILKIDGSVIKRVKEFRGYLAIEAIVRFAHSLGIQTVAEFVEDEESFSKLKELGIEMYQGFYFSKPKPIKDL